MRRRTAVLYALSIFPLSAAAFAVACGGDDSGGVHGEVFGPDGGGTDAPSVGDSNILPTGDAAPDNDGSTILPDGAVACTAGTIAIVGGGASSSFASVSTGSGAFTTQNFASVGTIALPSIVAFGSGFQAVFTASGTNALMATGYASPTWSAPAAISGTYALEMPTLAIANGIPNLVYEGNFDDAGGLNSHDYFHGTLTGSTWSANDPVGTPNVNQSFGSPHSLGAAGLATELVTGFVGSNNNVYARSLTTTWQAQDDVVSTAGSLADITAMGTAPRLVALTSGPEILAVYTRQSDYKLMYVTRTAGTWSAPAMFDVAGADYTTEAFNLAPLAGGKAIAAWRGSNMYGYASIYNGTSWSTAFALTTFVIASAPAVSVGNCGSVAIAAYAKTGGIDVVRYDGTSWSPPVSVNTIANVGYVATAVSP